MKRKQRDTLARSAMKLLCTLLGLVLVVMLGATWAFQTLLDSIQYTPVPQPERTLSDYLTAVNLSASGREESLIGGRGSGIVNILLIGQDRREGEGQARSDSMILCTFHKESGQITMTSFLRDLYLPIPGHGENRINAAYTSGGMSLLTDTLKENFSLHIDGCIEVDFAQFTTIIDLLGGVPIDLRADEAQIINEETGSSLTEGTHNLTGAQALTYSRIRYLDSDGDFSRTNRQRKVISALVDTFRETDLSKTIPLLGQLLPMVTTDMNQGKILLLAMDILPHLSSTQIVSQRIPADGAFQDQSIHGMSVLVPDLEATRQLLRSTLLEG